MYVYIPPDITIIPNATIDYLRNLDLCCIILYMYHIKEKTTAETEVKRSRFIGILLPVQDESEVKPLLSEIRKEYPNATHYCTALICGNIQRSNDDGEPSGTAGLPMLECLRHAELDNVLLVVVRYFGGTLLGTGGLVKAYQSTANLTIESATLTLPVEVNRYEVAVDYDYLNKIENLLQNESTIVSREYGEQAYFTFDCERDLTEEFLALTAGKSSPQFTKSLIVEKEI